LASVLILGATSGIGRAVAAEFARHGYDVTLAGRNPQDMAALAADLALRYNVKTRFCEFDVVAIQDHASSLRACLSEGGGALEGVVLCVGYLGDQHSAQRDFCEARRILDTNLTGCISALNIIANHFEERRKGFICALSSVAGDRGRQSNYLYGAAKAGLSVYLQGLRNRLFHSSVSVITIKPGFVDTAMTYGKSGMFLVASPESVAREIFKAIRKGTDITYIPWFWRPLIFMIHLIPERFFKRLRF
jgi:short-subunit dehydrogenase